MPEHSGSESPYEFAPREPAKPIEPVAPATPDTPVIEEVAVERSCPHCGFRIVGKPRGGRCPECAAALDEVATDLLQFSDAQWLANLSNGTLLYVLSILVQILAIAMVWSGGGRMGNALHLAGALAGLAGIWMATTSEPGAGWLRTPLAPLARLIGIAVAILWIGVALWAPAGAQPEGLTRAQALIVAVLVGSAVQAIVLGMHLRSLARRVPNDSLGAHLFNSAVLFAGSCLLMLGVNSLNIADSPTPFFFFCVPAGGVIAAIIAWTMFTIVRMGLEFRHCVAAGQTIVARQATRAATANAPRPERAG